MIAIQEVTKWNGDIQPNHTYLMNGEKIVAYIPKGKKDVIQLRVPLRLDKRGRQFVELKSNPFNIKIKSSLIEVKGSKGNTYYIDPDAKSCTCSGYSFRKTCRHLNEVLV
mgnify:FL=1